MTEWLGAAAPQLEGFVGGVRRGMLHRCTAACLILTPQPWIPSFAAGSEQRTRRQYVRDEGARRRALCKFNIVHTGRDANFERIAYLAKLVFSTRIVTVSLVDAEEEWFKMECEFDAYFFLFEFDDYGN